MIVGHNNNLISQKEVVIEILDEENLKDWNHEFVEFNKRIASIKEDTIIKLQELKNAGKRVAAIGASTKGNVLLQYYGLDSNLIECIGEVNQNKYGCTTPGTGIPIVSEDEVLKSKPDYLFILPWHFKNFFLNSSKFKGFSVIFPLPNLEIIDL